MIRQRETERTETSQVQVESDFVFKMADRYQSIVRWIRRLFTVTNSVLEKNGFD